MGHTDDRGRRTCFYTNESFFDRASQGYKVAVVTENVAGYRSLTSPTCRTLAEAQAEADALNAKFGISRDDVLDIVASSMRGGQNNG